MSADEVRRASDRVERLLGELRASLSPTAWPKVEELLATITGLYGQGISRILDGFAESGAIDEKMRARLCEDPLVASLLVLHGLHPLPPEDRARMAVERVSRSSGGGVELVGVDAQTRVRLSGKFRVARAEVEAAIERALSELAPDAPSLAVTSENAHFHEELVQLRVREAVR